MTSNGKVVAIGEILWDIFLEEKHLGGAPCNFAYHCKQLGLDSVIVSAIGKDELGNEIVENLNNLELKGDFIERTDFPTGTVQVTLNDGQPSYEIVENVAWDNISFRDELKELAENTQVVCFGSLASRLSNKTRETVQKFINLLSEDTLKIFDINLRQHYYSKELIEEFLDFANVLKINDEEVEVVADLFKWENLTEDEILNKLVNDFNLKLVVLTKGDKGSVLFDGKTKSEQLAGKVNNFKDAVGAGDSFTAVVAYGLIDNWSLDQINKIANKVAAIICANSGATPKIENIKGVLE